MTEWNITVQFSPQMRTDGEMVRVTILQRRGNDEEQILLTEEQARSLVDAINARLPRASLGDGVRRDS